MAATINTFRNVRARIKRESNGVWLAGWVTHLAREEARIRLWNFVPLESGEKIHGECYGQGTVARFGGTVVAQAGQDIAILIQGSISYAPSDETPRICTQGLSGEIKGPNGTASIMVLDISPLSLGALADAPVDSTPGLRISLTTETGPIDASVSVANCRPDPDSPGYYRVGLHLLEMARLDRARWGRLVSERAEA